ncbi:MAG: tRNA (N(6)-L-threonylcarbamoyladenosine(37)-C(2))-methylthiotransferase MtaB, partial [Anaerovoracaceae bacterium]
MNNRKVEFYTLGCKVNQYETQKLKEKFEERGYDIASSSNADIHIINTCTVTHIADKKSRQYIRRAKKNNPEAIIVVTGCYVEVSKEELEKITEIDLLVSNKEKSNIVDLIESEFYKFKQNNEESSKEISKEASSKDSFKTIKGNSKEVLIRDNQNNVRTRAYIKIQEGCNRYCAYCIVPYARNTISSRDENQIIEEVKALIKDGYKEIVLTGINTALYGQEDILKKNNKGLTDIASDFPLANLIGRINSLSGDFRIRLSSLEPTVVNKENVKTLFQYDKLCHHLHLSLQSGSDNVLKAMNRKYSRAEYLEIIKELREFDPLYGITTDIIVGFPGETEEDFVDTKKTVINSEFLKAHIFKYSKREGTLAAEMKKQISAEAKEKRSKELFHMAEKTAELFLNKNLDTVNKVLFEEYNKELAGVVGYTDNYIRCLLKCSIEESKNYINEIVSVKISKVLEG